MRDGPRVLIAPDKFKGTYTAEEVADALALGATDAGAAPILLPVADGGEGTAAVLRAALGGSWRSATVEDPLGRPVAARYALLADGHTAAIDTAEASGLWRVGADERDPVRASSAGTGQLIAAAARDGATTVLLGAGGSASTDGGVGALAALQRHGTAPRLRVLCDVQTSFVDAARVFAPQKGATPADVAVLTARLERVAERLRRDPQGCPMTGCAGGLSGGLWAELDAELVPGAEFVLVAVGLPRALEAADLVITGEGAIDEQTGAGKAAATVAAMARRRSVTAYAVAGRNELPPDRARALGFAAILEGGDPQQLRHCARRIVEWHATRRAHTVDA